MSAKPSASAVLDLKSTSLCALSLVLRSPDLDALRGELDRRYGDSPGLFDHEPVLADLGALPEAGGLDLAALRTLLAGHGLMLIAARGSTPEHQELARSAGLIWVDDVAPPAPPPPAASEPEAEPEPEPEPLAQAVPTQAPAPPAEEPARGTVIIDRPLRSGQQVYARGADLVVLAMVNAGADLLADGSIHVYAPLRGRAFAGASGDTGARIFSTCMEPQMVSIGGLWKLIEEDLEPHIKGQPAQVRLDGTTLRFDPLKS